VLASHGTDSEDASGSLIEASKPVQVIGGHSCANIPEPATGACDHIEEALFPTQILGTDYVVSYPAAVASESPYVLRISAVKDDTKVEFDPALSEPIMLGPGDPPFELRIGRFPFFASGRAVAAAETEGFVKLIFDAKYGELLGAHLIGSQATELIAELVLAKTLEATEEEILRAMHPHPTYSEAVMEAAGQGLGESVHI